MVNIRKWVVRSLFIVWVGLWVSSQFWFVSSPPPTQEVTAPTMMLERNIATRSIPENNDNVAIEYEEEEEEEKEEEEEGQPQQQQQTPSQQRQRMQQVQQEHQQQVKQQQQVEQQVEQQQEHQQPQAQQQVKEQQQVQQVEQQVEQQQVEQEEETQSEEETQYGDEPISPPVIEVTAHPENSVLPRTLEINSLEGVSVAQVPFFYRSEYTPVLSSSRTNLNEETHLIN